MGGVGYLLYCGFYCPVEWGCCNENENAISRRVLRSMQVIHLSIKRRLIVLSHWPHVATQVEQQVAELVAELVFAMYLNGTVHTSNKLLNLCPRMLLEPFTLDTC